MIHFHQRNDTPKPHLLVAQAKTRNYAKGEQNVCLITKFTNGVFAIFSQYGKDAKYETHTQESLEKNYIEIQPTEFLIKKETRNSVFFKLLNGNWCDARSYDRKEYTQEELLPIAAE